MKKSTKIIIGVVVAAVIGALIYFFYSRSQKAKSATVEDPLKDQETAGDMLKGPNPLWKNKPEINSQTVTRDAANLNLQTVAM
jgi:flagellar basal body-associated protein FliL